MPPASTIAAATNCVTVIKPDTSGPLSPRRKVSRKLERPPRKTTLPGFRHRNEGDATTTAGRRTARTLPGWRRAGWGAGALPAGRQARQPGCGRQRPKAGAWAFRSHIRLPGRRWKRRNYPRPGWAQTHRPFYGEAGRDAAHRPRLPRRAIASPASPTAKPYRGQRNRIMRSRLPTSAVTMASRATLQILSVLRESRRATRTHTNRERTVPRATRNP